MHGASIVSSRQVDDSGAGKYRQDFSTVIQHLKTQAMIEDSRRHNGMSSPLPLFAASEILQPKEYRGLLANSLHRSNPGD